MKKLTFIYVLVALLLTTVQGRAQSTYKSGVYAGALLGYSRMHVDFTNTYSSPPGQVPRYDRQTFAASQGNITGGLLLGYRYLIGSFLLGFDCDLSLYNSNVREGITIPFAIPSIFSGTLQRHYSATPSAVLGILFSEKWHGFFKLGLGVSKFTVSVVNELGGSQTTFSRTETVIGFVPAIGIEYAATDSISVLGTLSYEWYKKVERTVGPEILADGAGTGLNIVEKIRARPQILNIKVGVIFKV